ncbi:MAG: GFA family protein [Parvularculaceae bacterium]|nr:GFA family protein [Parvularculaceae bacterium]
MSAITGGCLCGAVRYEIALDPVMMGNCHCRDCQKYSGTGHGSNLAFPDAGVEISGEMTKFDVEADSGATVSRLFCPKCGVKICSVSTGFDGLTMISAGTLDDPELFKPMFAVYADSAPGWDQPGDGVVSFAQMPPQG